MKMTPIAGAKLKAELERDPEYQERRRRDERRRKKLREATQPVVSALSEAGIKLDSPWALTNAATLDPEILAVLLEQLQLPYPSNVRKWIARAMAIPEVRAFWDELVALFEAEPTDDTGVKFEIGLCLAAAADRKRLEDVHRLIRDRRHGSSRLALILPLMRLRDPRRDSTFAELADDPDLHKEIAVKVKEIERRRRKRENS